MNADARSFDPDSRGPRDFPSTCWSKFLAAPAGDGESRRVAATALAERYWRSIFAYVRSRWSRSTEDAQDLTQAFFLWMMETDFVDKADPRRGRFRAFVKSALDHFVMKEHRDRQAAKRGGGRLSLPFGSGAGDLAALGVPDPSLVSADEALDRTWRNELMAEAAARLEKELRAEQRDAQFELFRAYHLSKGEPPSMAALAASHGLTEGVVKGQLVEAKRRYRAALTDVVAETVSTDRDLREELESLFGKGGP